MKNTKDYKIYFILLLTCLLFQNQLWGQHENKLEEIFKNPPVSARPWGYWLWPHGNFEYSRMREELKAFKEMGMGGVDIFDIGIKDPLDQIPEGYPFMGQKMLDGIVFANKVAKELDFKLGLSVSNGWNAGGDWMEPDEMIMQLLFWKDTLTGPVELTEIGFPKLPRIFKKPYGTFELFPQFNADGFPVYYKNVGLMAYPFSKDNTIENLDNVLFLDKKKINGNQINIVLPEGKWVLTRAVVCPLGQKQWMRSDNSNGFIMDHYSKKATKHHFDHIVSTLENRLGDLGNSALERLYLASFEAEDYIIWSPELKEAFKEQHGYEIDNYLPVLAGQKLWDNSVTERFLYDYRSTVSEMFVNNHYEQAKAISNTHDLLLASESGGPGLPLHYVPTEDLKALGAVDIMRGEFWNKESEYFDENGNDLLQVVKNIASAAHIYGHKVVEMESFTSHRRHWDETPIELKRLADQAFCEGMNRVVYHTTPHSPKEAGVPGWSYSAGTHISPKMAWWNLSKPFHSYLARTSALLQEGGFVADVAYYYGEQLPKFASGSKFIRKTLGYGYDYDDLNKEVLLQSSVTNNGKLRLPSGMTYNLLVLPNDKAMSLEVLEKIKELLEQGATILGNAPSTVWGLNNYKTRESKLRGMASELWGKARKRQKRLYGKGILYSGYDEKDILKSKGVLPDFRHTEQEAKLDYIHRRSGKDDIYFIRNTDSLPLQTTVDVRSNGRNPFIFDPVTGKIVQLAFFQRNGGRTQVPLYFDPYGSTFLILRKEDKPLTHIVSAEQSDDYSSVKPMFWFDGGEIKWSPELQGSFKLTYSNGTTKIVHMKSNEIHVIGPWNVHFPYGWDFEPIQKFDELTDWSTHEDPGISIFSGPATYKTSFEINNSDTDHILDLGQVGVAARVYLNGMEIGIRVFPPYRFDISRAVKHGLNYLEVEVASTWRNRLVGDLGKPKGEQRTNSNVAKIVSNKNGKTKWGRLWEGYAKQPSGLIGPVRIIEINWSQK